MKNKFGTVYDRQEHFCCPGSDEKLIYAMQLQADGSYDLEIVGKESWHELIQSHFESCNIDSILERYKAGDIEAFNKLPGQYGDFSDMPDSPFEIYRQIRNAENEFNHLPVDIKEKFDHSYDRFVSMMGSEAWFDYMGYSKKNPDTVPDTVKDSVPEGGNN